MTPIEVRDYDQLVRALRARCAELSVAGETIDEVAGLPARYTAKLLAPVPIKGFGRASLGPLLGALGLMIVVVEDAEALARVAKRLIRKEPQFTSTGLHARNHRANKGDSEWGRLMNCRRKLKLSRRRRSLLAKIAIKARWAKKRA